MTSQRGVGKAGIDQAAGNHKAEIAVCPLRGFAARTIWGKLQSAVRRDGGAYKNMPKGGISSILGGGNATGELLQEQLRCRVTAIHRKKSDLRLIMIGLTEGQQTWSKKIY
jgi:hypothetical protein